MIALASMNAVRHIQYNSDATIYAIVCKMTYPIKGVKQLSELAPSTELFHWYCNQARKHQWNGDAFRNSYVPWFLRELAENARAQWVLDNLVKLSQSDTVVLACYCTTEQLCHRSIVGGIMEGMGAEVQTSTGLSYISYYEQFKALRR